MTDEEMAEDYAERNLGKYTNEFGNIYNAFLAGLKAGRPKWHKVADGEYPKRTGEYLTNIGVLTWDYYGDGRYGWHTEFCEHCDCMDVVDSDEVIAWCEIPQYTED